MQLNSDYSIPSSRHWQTVWWSLVRWRRLSDFASAPSTPSVDSRHHPLSTCGRRVAAWSAARRDPTCGTEPRWALRWWERRYHSHRTRRLTADTSRRPSSRAATHADHLPRVWDCLIETDAAVSYSATPAYNREQKQHWILNHLLAFRLGKSTTFVTNAKTWLNALGITQETASKH